MEFFRNLIKGRRDRVAFLDFVEQSEDALRELDASNDVAWGFRNAVRSHGPQPGMVRFLSPDGCSVTARSQVVGTLNVTTEAWQWAWDSSSTGRTASIAAGKTREFGLERRMESLTVPRFAATLIEAWGFCAVTCAIAGAQGAFAEASGPGFIFFVFDSVHIENARQDFLNDGLVVVERPRRHTEPGR